MKRSDTGIIGFLFFLSGAISLVYESIWVRVLSLGVGSTSIALSLVLGIFFLGLGIGSWFTGQHLHRTRNPLLLYGLLEGSIGVYSLILIYVLLA